MEREQSTPLDFLIVLVLIVAAAIALPHVRNAVKPVIDALKSEAARQQQQSLLYQVDLPVIWRSASAVQESVLQYSELPFTDHAKKSHAGQSWNAATISTYFDAGRCLPQIDICMGDDAEIHWCELGNGLSIGLVIGHTFQRIVTGFSAPTEYWADRCQ